MKLSASRHVPDLLFATKSVHLDGGMTIYTFYIDDDRYRVPSLLSEALADDAHALKFAHQLFSRSDHYYSIEIWDDDRFVARDTKPSDSAAHGLSSEG